MIGDTVAIQVPDAVSERDEGRAIGACEAALGDNHCGRLEQGFVADYTARVTQSSAAELTIELFLSGLDDAVTVRVLKFSEDELEAFRWQSVGVVVGALVLSQPEVEEKKRPPAETPPEKPIEPKSAKPKAEPERPREKESVRPVSEDETPDVATVDIAPLVATSYSGTGVAGGVWLGGALVIAGPLHAVAQGEASFSPANGPVERLRTSSVGVSLGPGLRKAFGESQFGGELSVRGAFQSLNVRAETGTEAGAASTTRWGARAGGGFFWLPSRWLGFVLGGDVGVLWPPIDLELGEPTPTRVSAIFWGGYLGLRVRLNHL